MFFISILSVYQYDYNYLGSCHIYIIYLNSLLPFFFFGFSYYILPIPPCYFQLLVPCPLAEPLKEDIDSKILCKSAFDDLWDIIQVQYLSVAFYVNQLHYYTKLSIYIYRFYWSRSFPSQELIFLSITKHMAYSRCLLKLNVRMNLDIFQHRTISIFITWAKPGWDKSKQQLICLFGPWFSLAKT